MASQETSLSAIEFQAQSFIDDQLRDQESSVSRYLRDKANEIADAERMFVPKRTGRTLASIHVEAHTDADGTIGQRVYSLKLPSNVLNSRKGYIQNRHSKNVKKRFAKSDTVRPAHPFVTESLFSVTKVNL